MGTSVLGMEETKSDFTQEEPFTQEEYNGLNKILTAWAQKNGFDAQWVLREVTIDERERLRLLVLYGSKVHLDYALEYLFTCLRYEQHNGYSTGIDRTRLDAVDMWKIRIQAAKERAQAKQDKKKKKKKEKKAAKKAKRESEKE